MISQLSSENGVGVCASTEARDHVTCLEDLQMVYEALGQCGFDSKRNGTLLLLNQGVVIADLLLKTAPCSVENGLKDVSRITKKEQFEG